MPISSRVAAYLFLFFFLILTIRVPRIHVLLSYVAALPLRLSMSVARSLRTTAKLTTINQILQAPPCNLHGSDANGNELLIARMRCVASELRFATNDSPISRAQLLAAFRLSGLQPPVFVALRLPGLLSSSSLHLL